MGFLFVLTQVGMRTLERVRLTARERSEQSAVKDYGQRP